MSEYITRKQLSERWNITAQTLRNWSEKKYGPTAHQFGLRQTVYLMSEVLEHEDKNPIFKNPPRNKA